MDLKLVLGLFIPMNVIIIVFSQKTNLPIHLTTKKGPIVGFRVDKNPATGVSYDAFLGIPYGNKPTRFQIAEARSNWTEPLLTQADGPPCPQPGSSTCSEDCLYLNVFTPPNASNTSSVFAVVVFIHGSAFNFGSSSSATYGPDFLVNSSVILVAMNYRLGATGFLTLGSAVAPGNLGLHDTLLALHWVHNEIAVFGGNPAQVTLYGQSAGSIMTQFHYISPLSIGLWSQVVASSGSMLSDWGHYTATEGERRARLLAKAVGCDSSANDATVLKCLQDADINDIVANQSITLSDKDIASGNYLPFIPVLDTHLTASKPFFNDTLPTLMAQAYKRAKPMITGFNADEGILKFVDDSWKKVEDNLDAFIPYSALPTLNEDQRTAISNNIRNRYFKNTIDQNKVEDIVRIYTDAMFAYPSIQVTRYFANLTYGYFNAYDGSWASTASYFSQFKMTGVNHGDELHYVFYSSLNSQQDLSNCPTNLPNIIMKDQLVGWLTTFAKTGEPGSDWPTVALGGYKVLGNSSLTNSSTLESLYFDFWANMTQAVSSAASTTLATFTTFFILFCIVCI